MVASPTPDARFCIYVYPICLLVELAQAVVDAGAVPLLVLCIQVGKQFIGNLCKGQPLKRNNIEINKVLCFVKTIPKNSRSNIW